MALYIEDFYDPRRRHSAIGFTSLTRFEKGDTHQTALHRTGASPKSLPESCPAIK